MGGAICIGGMMMWALFFGNEFAGQCFAQRHLCEIAASGANAAYMQTLASTGRSYWPKVDCVQQSR